MALYKFLLLLLLLL